MHAERSPVPPLPVPVGVPEAGRPSTVPLSVEQAARLSTAVRWAARLAACGPGGPSDVHERWPVDTPLPRGIDELARRAHGSGRVTRVALPDERDEWLAIPHGGDTVTVLGARDLDDERRARLLAAFERGEAEGSRAPATMRAPMAPRTPAVSGEASIERSMLDALAAHGALEAVALAMADATATVTGSRRVTLGVERAGRARLLAISGEARPDRRRDAVRALQRALQSALDGHGVAPDDGDRTTVAVCRQGAHGAPAIAVLERTPEQAFTDAERAAIERELDAALALIGWLEQGKAGRLERAVDRVRAGWRELRRGEAPRLRWIAVASLPVLIAALSVPLPYRVSARVVVEASERQVLTAPHAGHVRSARARAGDTVSEGEVLATLDDRELSLARDRWLGEASKNRAEQSRALAARDRVELARLRADEARLEAELALVDERRARGILRAPFDGIVIAGDPTRSLGAPVAAGDVLFEVAASARRSSLVEIEERDIAWIAPGARIAVRMAASPREVREATLDALVPVAVAETGRSVFRVPATFVDGADAALSPGMQGVARIDAGKRSLASAWTRVLRERLLLLGWSLGLVR